MINYDEDWIILLLFHTKGSVARRSCWFAIPAALTASLLVQMDMTWPNFRSDVIGMGLDKSQIWNASIFLLSALMAFRTNRAMARFWEGTGLLHQMRGEWFDAVSCCVTFSRSAKAKKPDDVHEFRHTLVRLMSVCHGAALSEIACVNSDEVETIDTFGLSNDTLLHLKRCSDYEFNRVEVILHMIQTLITSAHEEGTIAIAPPILSRVYQTLSRGFVNLLNAKKIADTRFPFPYAQLIALLLFLNCFSIPFMISECVPNRLLAAIFAFLPIFGLSSLNYIGIELENPFGDDDNDLPLGHFQREMNRCLLMLLEPQSDTVPCLSMKRAKVDFRQLNQDAMRGTTHRITHWRESLKLATGQSLETAFQAAAYDAEDVTKKKKKSEFAKVFDPQENLEELANDAPNSNGQQLGNISSCEGQDSVKRFQSSLSNGSGSPTSVHTSVKSESPINKTSQGRGPTASMAGVIPFGSSVAGEVLSAQSPTPALQNETECGTSSLGVSIPKQRLVDVAKDADEFARSLQRWTEVIESQIHDLIQRSALFAGQSDSIPI